VLWLAGAGYALGLLGLLAVWHRVIAPHLWADRYNDEQP
jgi:hypothetical protein